LGVVLVIGLGSAVSAKAVNLITDGSFEQGFPNGLDNNGAFTTVYGGDNTSLPSWTVTGDSIYVLNSSQWTASNGVRSIDRLFLDWSKFY